MSCDAAGHELNKLVSTFFGYTHGERKRGLEGRVLTSPLDDNMTPEDMFGVNADALLTKRNDPADVFNKIESSWLVWLV